MNALTALNLSKQYEHFQTALDPGIACIIIWMLVTFVILILTEKPQYGK